VASSSTTVTPKVAVLPSTGDWAGMLTYAATSTVTPSVGDTYWLVVWEATGEQGFQYTLTAASVPRTSEEEPNDSSAAARPMTLPGIGGLSQLSSLADVDYFKVSASALDVGKRFHVVTQPGDDRTDTVVQLFRTDGTTPLGPQSDNGYHEDTFSNAIPAAGDYFVKVSMSTAVATYNSNESHYDLLVTVE